MIPDSLKKYIDELIQNGLNEMDGTTSTTASAGGAYNSKFFLKKPKKLEEKTPTLAAGKANISSYTKDGFTPAKEGMPSDSKIYDYKQFPSEPKPKRYKLYKELKVYAGKPTFKTDDFDELGNLLANIYLYIDEYLVQKDYEIDIKDVIEDDLFGEETSNYISIFKNDLPNEFVITPDDKIGKKPILITKTSKESFKWDEVSKNMFNENKLKELVKQELLNEISYRRFNENVSKITPERKITRALNEVTKRIKEIEQVIEYSQRLKTENVVKKEAFWENKLEQLNTLSEKLDILSKKIKTLSK